MDGDGFFLANSQEKAYEKIVMEIRNKSRGFLPDRRVGEKVAKWKPGQGSPQELGSYFEGDIIEPPPSLTRNGVIETRYRWPQGVIPYVGTAIHELLHTIGFYHEQSRSDRDNYVTINYNNIEPGMANNFDISDTITFGVPYDYGSVMHYGRNFFSKNGLDTIVPKDNWVTIGQRTHLSNSDIAKIRRMYKCYGATSYV
ncbi:hypothetical protein B566_EDAN001841 [Ephemera danica]|nr:hypothetical protein B566_EDAN001841 [Ephemera danica]